MSSQPTRLGSWIGLGLLVFDLVIWGMVLYMVVK
jgi:hypothetical protein